ncbi:putative leucine-rich repeat transmembrane protein kinase family protein isoform X2 [Zea mays]|nr:putative leucine-rich repeat transmembrane protein kinase family protein precursor [Zea mays]XP_020397426.1 putative leucine-rich repeat transmembrane protein kinase family protein isoform X2 [Zea mays]ACF78560.1 unknown [Zea mays]AQK97284.1 Protein MALE DISCOVERER 2 [Zea mays]AQK97286.1 Protein MALE DISCOVERER 2 [Zea mays]AQK97287.1 Protein MALE DISCOVERER 2 [Zea mays]|eukprot:NP_001130369.1 putative leucine-rich repeat transmembrane protein kinase family protein precursor [Zea mays]
MDGSISSALALLVLALHLAVDGCSAVNFEGSVLLKFQSRVEEDLYGAMVSWSPGDGDPCSWNGVRCADGRVVMLNLKDLSLKGTLGPELGTLSHLRALELSNNFFSGAIPKELSALAMLEILDLSNNNLSGEVPQEIAEMPSLRQLSLSNNCFQWPLIQHSYGNFDQENGFNIYDNLGRGNMNQRAENGLESGSSSHENKKDTSNLSARLHSQYEAINPAAHLSQRRLLQDSNLAAPSSANDLVPAAVPVPSTGTGSFSAFSPNNAPAPAVNPPSRPPTVPSTTAGEVQERRSMKWLYFIVLPLVVLLIGIACMLLLCRTKSGTTIGPWKTGLSGQLQKAFVTGVPKLQRSELEGACEDFSNIVSSYPQYTVYKGTLSSGVEIAVVSTMVISSKDWSKHSEGRFRKKIDSLSRINHKNYINLLGYCEEEEPFTRMMVMEYAPNGTLYEHLHVEGFDPIDWNGRMRIIMGVAYCTLHMHELSPPVTHPDIKSSAILLSEDGAAKIVDMSVWHEVYFRGNMPKDGDLVDHQERVAADPAGNVYSFGLLMLEIISGKPPYSEEKGSLSDLALECIRDNRSMSCLLDPSLKDHKEKDLETICDLVQDCIQSDPKKRPAMREVTTRLREVLSISPEAATPRLSPLWWAELEILSVEAS